MTSSPIISGPQSDLNPLDYQAWGMLEFLANVNSRSRSQYIIGRTSVCRLSVTFVRPTQAIEIFRQCFYTIWHAGHLLTSI